MSIAEKLELAEAAQLEVSPCSADDAEALARRFAFGDIDPAEGGRQMAHLGIDAETLQKRVSKLEPRPGFAKVYNETSQREAAAKKAVEFLADTTAAAKARQEAAEAADMKLIREAELAVRDTRAAVQECDNARHKLIDTAGPREREAWDDAKEQRLAAQRRESEVEGRYDENAAILEARQRRLDSGEFLKSAHGLDEAAAHEQAEQGIAEAKRAVASDAADLEAAQQAVEFARQCYDAAVEEMLRP